MNIATSFAGGVVGKLAVKYGLPWKWKKAVALGKSIAGLVGKLVSSFRAYWKQSKAAAQWSRVAARVAKKQGDEAMPASCPVSNSFTPDTRVLMADGSTKPIGEVDIGDRVRATDPETGETTVETVTAEILGTGLKHLVHITIDVDGDKGEETASVTATDGHPFWVPELDAWIDATDLTSGQWLRTSAGTHVQITALTHTTQPATVHNLTVSDAHTYYVLAGQTPVLVHNSNGVGCGPGGSGISARHEKAGDIDNYTDGQSTRDPASQWYHEELSNDELLDSINNAGEGDGILVSRDGTILGGHHRKDELRTRIRDGRIDPDTQIRIDVYDGE